MSLSRRRGKRLSRWASAILEQGHAHIEHETFEPYCLPAEGAGQPRLAGSGLAAGDQVPIRDLAQSLSVLSPVPLNEGTVRYGSQ